MHVRNSGQPQRHIRRWPATRICRRGSTSCGATVPWHAAWVRTWRHSASCWMPPSPSFRGCSRRTDAGSTRITSNGKRACTGSRLRTCSHRLARRSAARAMGSSTAQCRGTAPALACGGCCVRPDLGGRAHAGPASCRYGAIAAPLARVIGGRRAAPDHAARTRGMPAGRPGG